MVIIIFLGYIDELLDTAFNMEVAEPEDIPAPMASLYSKPEDPESLKAAYFSRFNNM